MRLKITHRTEYRYDAPVQYLLQRLRLLPVSGQTQTVLSWSLKVEGAREEVRFTDHYGNDTRLLSVEGDHDFITVEASGEVVTRDTSGVCGSHQGFAPLWLRSLAPMTAKRLCRSGDTVLSRPGRGAALHFADRRHPWRFPIRG